MTTLARYPFADIRERLDRAFEDLTSGDMQAMAPALDIVEEDAGLRVHADMPGLKPDEITVEVSGGVLTISGEHEETREEKEGRFVRRERSARSFSRSIALPETADTEHIEAHYDAGVLDLMIPCQMPAGTRRIEVKVQGEGPGPAPEGGTS